MLLHPAHAEVHECASRYECAVGVPHIAVAHQATGVVERFADGDEILALTL
jgi:hypothetical protein